MEFLKRLLKPSHSDASSCADRVDAQFTEETVPSCSIAAYKLKSNLSSASWLSGSSASVDVIGTVDERNLAPCSTDKQHLGASVCHATSCSEAISTPDRWTAGSSTCWQAQALDDKMCEELSFCTPRDLPSISLAPDGSFRFACAAPPSPSSQWPDGRDGRDDRDTQDGQDGHDGRDGRDEPDGRGGGGGWRGRDHTELTSVGILRMMSRNSSSAEHRPATSVSGRWDSGNSHSAGTLWCRKSSGMTAYSNHGRAYGAGGVVSDSGRAPGTDSHSFSDGGGRAYVGSGSIGGGASLNGGVDVSRSGFASSNGSIARQPKAALGRAGANGHPSPFSFLGDHLDCSSSGVAVARVPLSSPLSGGSSSGIDSHDDLSQATALTFQHLSSPFLPDDDGGTAFPQGHTYSHAFGSRTFPEEASRPPAAASPAAMLLSICKVACHNPSTGNHDGVSRHSAAATEAATETSASRSAVGGHLPACTSADRMSLSSTIGGTSRAGAVGFRFSDDAGCGTRYAAVSDVLPPASASADRMTLVSAVRGTRQNVGRGGTWDEAVRGTGRGAGGRFSDDAGCGSYAAVGDAVAPAPMSATAFLRGLSAGRFRVSFTGDTVVPVGDGGRGSSGNGGGGAAACAERLSFSPSSSFHRTSAAAALDRASSNESVLGPFDVSMLSYLKCPNGDEGDAANGDNDHTGSDRLPLQQQLPQHYQRVSTGSRNSAGSSVGSRGTAAEQQRIVSIDASELKIFGDQVIGAGRFSTVFRGEYRGVPCAVKMLESLITEEYETFCRELSVTATLSHPNVVRYHGGSCLRPHVYVVQELMETKLSDVLHGEPARKLSLKQAVSIALDIARGLNYVHTLSPPVVHRDLKPDNILLDFNGVAKIADFGLSRSKYNSYVKTTRLSAGTLTYMAPECFDVTVGRLTEKCDIFSFGVMLWELCNGQRPWENIKAHHFLQRMVVDGARLPLSYDDNVCPMALRNMISQCWCTDPEERPSSGALVAQLERIAQYTR